MLLDRAIQMAFALVVALAPSASADIADLANSPRPAGEYRAPRFEAAHSSCAPHPLSEPDVILQYVADPGHDPVAVLDPGVVPALSSCMRELWKPSMSELCAARWSVARAVGSAHDTAADRRHSCETVGGRTALAMTSYGDKRNALQDFAVTIPGGGDAGRMTAQMFIPSDYQPYTAGRLAFGMTVGERKCSGGGCLPDEQGGADIRVNFRPRDGSIVLANYSYHLDRDTGARTTASSWEGRGRDVRSFGRPVLMKRGLPKGEWITLQLDVVLNTPGRADGSSVLSAYDSQGRLIDSAAHRGVTYRRDASWKISGPALTEKPNDTGPAPKTQAWYFRDYRLATGDSTAVCP